MKIRSEGECSFLDSNKNIDKLYQYASQHRFEDFDGLFLELEQTLSTEEFWEAYLMRAQIRLYATDNAFVDDLDHAEGFAGTLVRFPALFTVWRCDSPNRFIVFPKTPGSLQVFLQKLASARERLTQWYGNQAGIAVEQLCSEIRYFRGEVSEALALAEAVHAAAGKNPTAEILNQSMRFRCNLALGRVPTAEESMLDMIRLSRRYPECQAIYQMVRGWANLTTNWNGDMPRFYEDSDGKQQPVLDDRLEGMRMGTSRTTQLEKPFVEYARRSYNESYPLRECYVDLIRAMYWHQAGDYRQTETYFVGLYHTVEASGVIMPFLECGEQILSLLDYVRGSDMDCPVGWLDKISAMARQYEKGMNAYRGEESAGA